MNIYILRPSKRWSYCGGGMVVVANSFEEVQKLFPDFNLHRTEDDANAYDGENYNNWTLVDVFNCPSLTETRVILEDYNWA